jgi:hypothetical protein
MMGDIEIEQKLNELLKDKKVEDHQYLQTQIDDIKTSLKELVGQVSRMHDSIIIIEKQINNGLKDDNKMHGRDIHTMQIELERFRSSLTVINLEKEASEAKIEQQIILIQKDLLNLNSRFELFLRDLEEKMVSKVENVLTESSLSFRRELQTHAETEDGDRAETQIELTKLKSDVKFIIAIGGLVWSIILGGAFTAAQIFFQ